MPRITNIKPRGGTAAQWTSANPVLSAREIGIETDTQKSKYGNGTSAWNDLPYSVANASGTSTVNWNSVLDKPSTFTPSAHASSHTDGGADEITVTKAQVTDLVTDLAAINSNLTALNNLPHQFLLMGA